MPQDTNRTNPYVKSILSWLLPLLNSDIVSLIPALWRIGNSVLSLKAHRGTYEIQDLDIQLELLDAKGKRAICHKREKVRFLQDNVMVFEDKVWGDGNIFADYQCSPGIAVDKYQEGHRWKVLISLRGNKQRGDEEEFYIRRVIEDGFTGQTQEFRTQVDTLTHYIRLKVVFPHHRFPHKVLLIQQNANRSIPAEASQRSKLPDGREQIRWDIQKPQLLESYTVHWEW